MELERIHKEKFSSKEVDENEDEDEDEDENENEESKSTPVNEARDYIRQLENIKDKDGNTLMHMAVKNIKKLKDSTYLNRLLELGFPMYQMNYKKMPTIYQLCEWPDDEMFVQAYTMFKKRGYNPLYIQSILIGIETSFLQYFFQNGHVTPAKINAIMSPLDL